MEIALLIIAAVLMLVGAGSLPGIMDCANN